jgi:hypothetical protein
MNWVGDELIIQYGDPCQHVIDWYLWKVWTNWGGTLRDWQAATALRTEGRRHG